MRRNVRNTVVGALLIMLLVSFNCQIQAEDRGSDHSPGEHRMKNRPPRHNFDSEKARKKIIALKIWKLTEELEIDDNLAQKMYPKIRELEALRFNAQKEMTQLVSELTLLLESEEVEADKLAEKVAQMKEHNRQHRDREVELKDSIMELLTVEQQAKYILVEHEFHQDIRRFLKERRSERKQKRRK